jgi:cbb3-type cytochrome oxidase subunit 3
MWVTLFGLIAVTIFSVGIAIYAFKKWEQHKVKNEYV